VTSDAKRLKVINLWAGPGAGKSTAGAGLFSLMKAKGYSVELVTEFAKEMVYEGRIGELKSNQMMVLQEQDRRLRRLQGQVTWAITDSPLPLSLAYRPSGGVFSKDWFTDAVLELFRDYENINVRINRVKRYIQAGRYQTKAEALKLDDRIDGVLKEINHTSTILWVNGDAKAPGRILDWLERHHGAFAYG